MKALVTGGGGFLGVAVCRALTAQGVQVRALDNGWRRRERKGLAAEFEYVQADVRDYEAVFKAARGCDTVWHLAYINGTKFFYEHPDLVIEVAVKGTLNTIEAAIAAGADRYVLASSSETYQQPTHLPTTESERLIVPDVANPRFTYGGGKIAAELMALHIAGRRGLEPVIFRPHNFYGPNMGFEHVIPELVRKLVDASNGLRSSKVQLELQGDGSDRRAFCYVDDGARGAVIAGLSGQPGEIYHVGTEEEISIASLAEQLAEILGLKVELVPGEDVIGGTTRRCPSISKLAGLGYKPEMSLDEGLRKTVEWYVDYYMAERRAVG